MHSNNTNLYAKFLQYRKNPNTQKENFIKYINNEIEKIPATERSNESINEKIQLIIFSNLISLKLKNLTTQNLDLKKELIQHEIISTNEKYNNWSSWSKTKLVGAAIALGEICREFFFVHPFMEIIPRHNNNEQWSASGAANELRNNYSSMTIAGYSIFAGLAAIGVVGYTMDKIEERKRKNDQEYIILLDTILQNLNNEAIVCEDGIKDFCSYCFDITNLDDRQKFKEEILLALKKSDEQIQIFSKLHDYLLDEKIKDTIEVQSTEDKGIYKKTK